MTTRRCCRGTLCCRPNRVARPSSQTSITPERAEQGTWLIDRLRWMCNRPHALKAIARKAQQRVSRGNQGFELLDETQNWSREEKRFGGPLARRCCRPARRIALCKLVVFFVTLSSQKTPAGLLTSCHPLPNLMESLSTVNPSKRKFRRL